MAKAVILTIWFISAISGLSVFLDMLSASNTVENGIGLFSLALLVMISIKTKCFIKILTRWKK